VGRRAGWVDPDGSAAPVVVDRGHCAANSGDIGLVGVPRDVVVARSYGDSLGDNAWSRIGTDNSHIGGLGVEGRGQGKKTRERSKAGELHIGENKIRLVDIRVKKEDVGVEE
jgi:hypothetical protein